MALLNTGHFKRLTGDPTAATERKMQRVLRKTKSKFSGARLQKIIPNRLSTSSILRYSQVTQVKKQ